MELVSKKAAIQKEVTDKPVIVSLPGPDGWPLYMLINPKPVTGNPEECRRLMISFSEP